MSDEKEELKELINLLYSNRLTRYGKRKLEDYIKNSKKELEQEKEKNKELEIEDLATVHMIGFYAGEKKWKDKIRAKIEELKNDAKNIREKKKNSHDYDRSKSRLQAYLTKTNEMIKRLKELLEE